MTQNKQYIEQHKKYVEQHKNYEECGPCLVLAGFTLAFALQLRKKHGKTSVRVVIVRQLAFTYNLASLWQLFHTGIVSICFPRFIRTARARTQLLT